jgi:hypothetical protein
MCPSRYSGESLQEIGTWTDKPMRSVELTVQARPDATWPEVMKMAAVWLFMPLLSSVGLIVSKARGGKLIEFGVLQSPPEEEVS